MQARPLTWLGAAALCAALSLLALSEPSLEAPPEETSFGTAGGSLTSPPAPWPAAADARRRGDFVGARRLIEPLAAGEERAAREARLVLGLWALSEGDHDRSTPLLQSAVDRDGRFEDWRLLALADSHTVLERLPAATAVLTRLLDTRPGSPLRPAAALRLAELAGRVGDLGRVTEMAAMSRREQFGSEQAEQLERAAWQATVESGDRDAQRRVARRLLVHQPIVASQLQVIELFRHPSGALQWLSFLTVEELLERTRSLLASGISAGALDALAAVPSERQDREWHLLQVEALTLARRGTEALSLAAGITADNDGDRIRLEMLRAQAAFEAARVRSGRPAPSLAERDGLRAAGRNSLWKAVEIAGSQPRHLEAALVAHRRLLTMLLEEDDAEPALALLRSLRRLDPDDQSGAAYLWRRGWSDFQQDDPSGALGYWSELAGLYPTSRYARAGRYWTARAHESLGNADLAETLYREVAGADAEDFYRRHAARRLGGKATVDDADSAPLAQQPWPWDTDLSRARWLSDRGLDEAALIELRGQAGRVDARAAAAFEAVVLARLGRRRDSIHAISRAFPELGTLEQDNAPDEAVQLYYPMAFEPIVRRFAGTLDVPAPLLFAMIRQESAFDPTAVSRSGARGLMQLMPATGRELAQRMRLSFTDGRLSDPEFNIRLGSSYFRQLLEMFEGSEELALAGYNGGPYRIKRLWREQGSPAELDRFVEGLGLSETTHYVKRIVLFQDTYSRLAGGRA